MNMHKALKMEELAMFGFSIYLFTITEFHWWWYPVLFLLPDIGMIGYIINSKVGAITYNLLHDKATAVILKIIGYAFGLHWVLLIGIIMFGHASFDRALGFGLKYHDDFKHTHLGWIGGVNSKA